jgi:hypothetical protein
MSKARRSQAAATGFICSFAMDGYRAGKAIGERSGHEAGERRMIKAASAIAAIGLVTMLGATAAQAQDLGLRPLRYGNTSGWYYDNRDDPRDYPTNGFFPGNFTADPSTAWLGISGALAGNSYRSPLPYPSQVVIGLASHQAACTRTRSYDAATGTYVGRDGLRHRC